MTNDSCGRRPSASRSTAMASLRSSLCTLRARCPPPHPLVKPRDAISLYGIASLAPLGSATDQRTRLDKVRSLSSSASCPLSHCGHSFTRVKRTYMTRLEAACSAAATPRYASPSAIFALSVPRIPHRGSSGSALVVVLVRSLLSVYSYRHPS